MRAEPEWLVAAGPHRERRGYGGDGHTSYQFALANYPVGAYFNKWMRDFADTQGVECRKDAGVIDETPRAYKPIDAVMAAQSDLVEIVHTLKQVVCVKG